MNIIETRNISRRYIMGSTEVNALQSVSIDIKKGEYVAFMGPSGSGKSTLMNIVGCLDTPTSGTYSLNNQLVSEMTENELAEVRNKEIGFVFQTFNLLPRASALENVALPLIYAGYGKSEREDMAMAALESVSLGDRHHHKPNELSGGQRQRVAIARALLRQPRLLLLDEATSALDPLTEVSLRDSFAALQNGRTTIVIAHRMTTVARADRIIVVDKGGVVESGAPQALLAQKGLYYAFHQAQLTTATQPG